MRLGGLHGISSESISHAWRNPVPAFDGFLPRKERDGGEMIFKLDPGHFPGLQEGTERTIRRHQKRMVHSAGILACLRVSPAMSIVQLNDDYIISGYIFQGKAGDYSRPVSSVRPPMR
jgi:hypothetical protein